MGLNLNAGCGTTDWVNWPDNACYSLTTHCNDGTWQIWEKTTETTIRSMVNKSCGSTQYEYFMETGRNGTASLNMEHFNLAASSNYYAVILGTGMCPAPNDGTWRQYISNVEGCVRGELWLSGVEVGVDTTAGCLPGNGTGALTNGRRTDTNQRHWRGDFAAFTVWKTSITAPKMEAMNRGVNSWAVDHCDIVLYAPYYDQECPQPEYIKQNNGTEAGTPIKATTHPPVELLETYI